MILRSWLVSGFDAHFALPGSSTVSSLPRTTHAHAHTHTHTRLDTIGGEGRGGYYIHSLTHTRGDKSHIPLQVTPHTHNGAGIRRHIFYKHCALISVAQYRQSPTCVRLLLMAAFGRHLAGNCGQLVYSCWLAMTT